MISEHCIQHSSDESKPYIHLWTTQRHPISLHSWVTSWIYIFSILENIDSVITGPYYQSGTKPNLVAKIWPPNLVTICAWLPNLVANVSFNTWLTQVCCWFSCQMATNNGSPHLQIRHNLSGLYLPNLKWLHWIIIAFNTLCPVEFYIKWCVALHFTHWGLILWKINLSLPWK